MRADIYQQNLDNQEAEEQGGLSPEAMRMPPATHRLPTSPDNFEAFMREEVIEVLEAQRQVNLKRLGQIFDSVDNRDSDGFPKGLVYRIGAEENLYARLLDYFEKRLAEVAKRKE